MSDLKATRRDFLVCGAAISGGVLLGGCTDRQPLMTDQAGMEPMTMTPEAAGVAAPSGPADVTLRIAPVLVDVAKDTTISTYGYNGTVPGPIVRLREGVPITVEIINNLDIAELVHWHGQTIPPAVDGAEEENSLMVPAHGSLRYRMTPGPSGFRFVHAHMMAGPDLHRGTYTGQFAPVYIEPVQNPGRYDQEVFLATHEWEPFFTTEEMEDMDDVEQPQNQPAAAAEKVSDNDAEPQSAGSLCGSGEVANQATGESKPNGWEIGYHLFSINGKALGFGEPIRVREGQQVLFHILNASATENLRLALPGHRFLVVGLDGNPVPQPQLVDVLQLGTAERIDMIVEMNNPGVWILGTTRDDDRRDGMGIVVEYANKSGEPQWQAPPKSRWDYTIFGDDRPVAQPDETIPLVFGKINGGKGGFNRWTVNGKAFKHNDPPQKLIKGRRYRFLFDNRTDDAHPIHLHRNVFELTNVFGKPTGGIMKDVVLVKGFGKVSVDFTPDQPGLTLFHCHQQLHMDYGFMKVFNVV